MAKRSKKKRIGSKYLENGKEVDINEYLSRGIRGIGVLNSPQFEVIEQQLRSMSYDDMVHRYDKGNDPLQIVDIYEERTFDSTLCKEHIDLLLPLVNKYVYAKTLSSEDMLEWLMCQNEEPIKVAHNGLLAYMMHLLSMDGWICQNWQKVADERKTFVSKNGIPIKKSNMSRSLAVINNRLLWSNDKEKGAWVHSKELYNAVKGLKR